MAKTNSKNRMSKKNRKNKSIKNKSKKIKSRRKKQHKGGNRNKYYTNNPGKNPNLSTSKMSPLQIRMFKHGLKTKKMKELLGKRHPELSNDNKYVENLARELAYRNGMGSELEKEFLNSRGHIGVNELRQKGTYTRNQEEKDCERAKRQKANADERAFNIVDYPRADALAIETKRLRQAGNYKTRFYPQNLASERMMEQIKETQKAQNNEVRMRRMLNQGSVSPSVTKVIVEPPISTMGRLRKSLKSKFWSKKKPKARQRVNLFGEKIFGNTKA